EFFGRAPGAGCHGAAASLCSALPQQAAFEREDGVVKKNLWKAALAGAIALATIGSGFAKERMATRFRPAAHAGFVLTDGQIHRMKAVLRLTRLQERYWPPIEAALHELAREFSHKSGAGEGRAAAVDQAKVQRLASVAYPLLMTLDENQKRDVMAFARAMGLGDLVAAF